MDIADLATFDDPADGSTIIVDSEKYGNNAGDGKLKVKASGITSNELATDSVTEEKIKDGAVTSDKISSSAITTFMPTGTILPFAGDTLPSGGWLFCDGSLVDRQSGGVNTALFNTIGVTYGVGNGSTTYNLPDLRGRVVAGKDDMGGSSADRLTNQSGGLNGDTLGATGGSETHTLTTSEIPAHTHTVSEASADAPAEGVGDGTTKVHRQDVQSASTGGGSAHNNVQPTIILNYIIKT